MKKIISLFQRNHDGDKLIRNEVTPGAEWVLAGEGLATRKYDGTATMVSNGELFKRYDAKQLPTQSALPGQTLPRVKAPKPTPPDFQPCQDPDPITGHWPGWVPVGNGPEDKWFKAAWEARGIEPPEGTYELCGPHFQANPENLPSELFFRHGVKVLDALRDTTLSFESIKTFLAGNPMEGIVWHHPDGRMVKIKSSDFGLPWGKGKH